MLGAAKPSSLHPSMRMSGAVLLGTQSDLDRSRLAGRKWIPSPLWCRRSRNRNDDSFITFANSQCLVQRFWIEATLHGHWVCIWRRHYNRYHRRGRKQWTAPCDVGDATERPRRCPLVGGPVQEERKEGWGGEGRGWDRTGGEEF